jgi:hypothetical protein
MGVRVGELEDAASWTIARALESIGSLASFLSRGLRSLSSDRGQALLWGVPLTPGAADAVAASIVKVSDDLGEQPMSRSEPDLILVWPDLIAFVEVKLDSLNEHKPPTYKGWDTYLPSPGLFASDDAAVRQAGWYELARNWVIGTRSRRCTTPALRWSTSGRPSWPSRQSPSATSSRRDRSATFEHRPWAEVLDASPALPKWAVSYAGELGLEHR